VKRIAIALLLLTVTSACVAAAPRETARLVVLEGTIDYRRTNDFAFLGDENSLEGVALGVTPDGSVRVSGADVMQSVGAQLQQQAAVYRAAQLARKVAPQDVQPLYVVIDPTGTWAYAHWRVTFRYRRGTGAFGPVTAPVLSIGRGMTFDGAVQVVDAASAARNERMLAVVERWYAAASGGRSLSAELERYTLTFPGDEKASVRQAARRVSTEAWRSYLEQIAIGELDGAGRAGRRSWDEGGLAGELAALQAEAVHDGARAMIAETVSHEMGHLIQFAAYGPDHMAPTVDRPHMEGMHHSLQTLSDERFAFDEGWAIANSVVVVGSPVMQPGANRVDYDETLQVVRKKLAANPSGPEAAHLRRLESWLSTLDKGRPRRRYDFLRSEWAVANALAALRQELGRSVNDQVLGVMAGAGGRRPTTLAQLVEDFVHQYPALRLRVYDILARASEGILVTTEQVAALVDRAEPFEIDIDRDGSVPGGPAVDAVKRLPTIFPVEPFPVAGSADPLAWRGGTTNGVAAAPAEPGQGVPPVGRPVVAPVLEPPMPTTMADAEDLPGYDELRGM